MPPNEKDEGEKIYECSVFKDKKVEVIPALEPETTETTESTHPTEPTENN